MATCYYSNLSKHSPFTRRFYSTDDGMQSTVISSEVTSEVILRPNSQQTRLLKEKEEDLVH